MRAADSQKGEPLQVCDGPGDAPPKRRTGEGPGRGQGQRGRDRSKASAPALSGKKDSHKGVEVLGSKTGPSLRHRTPLVCPSPLLTHRQISAEMRCTHSDWRLVSAEMF